ncbi:hypothetical protein PT974_11402 [Cladobotryum mycophilum]|uniref:Uncharacterized protein n=1 Tax=Cladobotryum mycophilum TaxID=491253 RepID=A0ABR0S534_9HYPO
MTGVERCLAPSSISISYKGSRVPTQRYSKDQEMLRGMGGGQRHQRRYSSFGPPLYAGADFASVPVRANNDGNERPEETFWREDLWMIMEGLSGLGHETMRPTPVMETLHLENIFL